MAIYTGVPKAAGCSGVYLDPGRFTTMRKNKFERIRKLLKKGADNGGEREVSEAQREAQV